MLLAAAPSNSNAVLDKPKFDLNIKQLKQGLEDSLQPSNPCQFCFIHLLRLINETLVI